MVLRALRQGAQGESGACVREGLQVQGARDRSTDGGVVVIWLGALCRFVGLAWIVAGLLTGQPVMLPLGAVMIGLGEALRPGEVRWRDPDALSPNPPGWNEAVAAYLADPHMTPEQLEAQWRQPTRDLTRAATEQIHGLRLARLEDAVAACECGPEEDSGCAPACRVCADMSGRGAYGGLGSVEHIVNADWGLETRGEWR